MIDSYVITVEHFDPMYSFLLQLDSLAKFLSMLVSSSYTRNFGKCITEMTKPASTNTERSLLWGISGLYIQTVRSLCETASNFSLVYCFNPHAKGSLRCFSSLRPDGIEFITLVEVVPAPDIPFIGTALLLMGTHYVCHRRYHMSSLLARGFIISGFSSGLKSVPFTCNG